MGFFRVVVCGASKGVRGGAVSDFGIFRILVIAAPRGVRGCRYLAIYVVGIFGIGLWVYLFLTNGVFLAAVS